MEHLHCEIPGSVIAGITQVRMYVTHTHTGTHLSKYFISAQHWRALKGALIVSYES